MMKERHLNWIITAIFLAVPLWALITDEPFTITLATKVAIFALAGVGLNLALGLGGLVSFGHAAFFGIGGYAAGILASQAGSFTPIMTWPFEIGGTTMMPIIWLVAIIAAGLIAIPIGIISLRTSGVYFIMITLAFAQMLYYFAISWPRYGGEDGLSFYVRNNFPGLNMFDPLNFFLIAAGLLFIVMFFASRLQQSRFGLALQASRQNELRTITSGIAPFKIRLIAFVLSAMIVGLAGALYADLNRFVSPTMLSWQISGEIMIFIILGGIGRLYGPLVGAALFVTLEHLLGGVIDYWQLLLGVALLLVVLFARGGLIGALTERTRHG